MFKTAVHFGEERVVVAKAEEKELTSSNVSASSDAMPDAKSNSAGNTTDGKQQDNNMNIGWHFAEVCQTKDDRVRTLVNEEEPDLKFELTVYHDVITHLETIGVDVILTGTRNRSGNKEELRISKVTDMPGFDNAMESLKVYGVFLAGTVIYKLKKEIEKNYNKIQYVEKAVGPYGISRDVLSETLDLLKEYIDEDKKENEKGAIINPDKNGIYYMPTKNFAGLLDDSDLRGTDVILLRRLLKDKGILNAKGKRTDIMKRFGKGDPVRALAIDTKRLDEAISSDAN